MRSLLDEWIPLQLHPSEPPQDGSMRPPEMDASGQYYLADGQHGVVIDRVTVDHAARLDQQAEDGGIGIECGCRDTAGKGTNQIRCDRAEGQYNPA